MIRFEGKITLLSNENSVITNATCNIENIANSQPLSSILGKRKKTSNPFLTGCNYTQDGSTFIDEIDYYIGKEISNNTDGTFENPYTIEISGRNLDHFTIIFDTYNYCYPTDIVIDGINYSNDDPFFTVANLTGNSHIIQINNWSRYGFPVKIEGIYTGISIDLNYSNISSIDLPINAFSISNDPTFGLISNSYTVEVIDKYGEIKEYVELGIFENANIVLYIINTKTNTKQIICNVNVSDISYDKQNKMLTVTIGDNLEQLQNITITGLDDISSKVPYTLKSLITYIISQTEYAKKYYIDEKTNKILEEYKAHQPYTYSGTAWQLLEELAKTIHLCIFINKYGYLTIIKI